MEKILQIDARQSRRFAFNKAAFFVSASQPSPFSAFSPSLVSRSPSSSGRLTKMAQTNSQEQTALTAQ